MDNLLQSMGIGQQPQRPPASVRGMIVRQETSASPITEEPQLGAKATPEQACFVTADKRCGDCANWEREAGACSKVEGTMRACDGCSAYFEPYGAQSMGAVMNAAPDSGMPQTA